MVGPAEYAFIRANVEAMTDKEIADELGVSVVAVEYMRSDLGLHRMAFHKVNSRGIEQARDFVWRMGLRLNEHGVTGDEARYFMAQMLRERIRDIDRVYYHSRLHSSPNSRDFNTQRKMQELLMDYTDELEKYTGAK